jgi:hypothetical protein
MLTISSNNADDVPRAVIAVDISREFNVEH